MFWALQSQQQQVLQIPIPYYILLSISGEAYNLRKSEDIPKVSQNPSNNILWRQLVHSGQNQFQNGQFYGVGGVGVPFKGFFKRISTLSLFFPKNAMSNQSVIKGFLLNWHFF